MENSEKLEAWIESLGRERLEAIALACIEELMITDNIRYYPEDEDLPNEPYWEVNGQKLDE